MLTKKVGNNAVMFGDHEEGTLRQLVDVSQRAERAALLADGHVGFTMPIGGVAAYRDKVSVVGVGFDIACLASGTPVATADGFTRPIEAVTDADAALCWDGSSVRPIAPHFGAVPRGEREILAISLGNGRVIRATHDHEILTRAGWKRADQLGTDDAVACTPYVGLEYEAPEHDIAVHVENARARAELAERGLLTIRGDDPRLPALVRLLGYVSGDGHLSKDGKRVSAYVFNDADAAELRADFLRLGFEPREHRRRRKAEWREEINLYVGSTALHALFAALGSPVGKKDWPAEPMPWLLRMPAWVRAHFLSAFASAEMMTPRIHRNGTIPNLQLKQSGRHTHAIDFIAGLLRSLEFEVSVAPSGPAHGGRVISVLQILGGQAEQLRFMRDVGFCRSVEKRVAAAAAASVAWQGMAYAANRDAAKEEARALRSQGVPWRTAVSDVAERFGVTTGFAYHAFYDDRGRSRRVPGEVTEPQADGEICWVPVSTVQPGGTSRVYDIVTGDPAHCFLASGVVVHNCGNAAIRTDLRVEDLTRNVSLDEIVRNPHRLAQNNLANNLADEIASVISFGIGRKNNADDAPVDHPLFRDPAWYAVPNTGGYRDTLQDKARRQLGTVGSGNHYVDVFADESGAVWVGVHFGSRGLGHTIASSFLSLSQGGMWGERAAEKEVLLDIDQPLGHDYWQLMQLAGEYAYAGREWVARKVVELLGGKELELVHNHHNFCIPGDQKVPTPAGPKRMDEIRPGDTVYAMDENGGLTETAVLRHWHSGKKETLTLRTANRAIRVSDDHPVLTIDVRSEAHPERTWHQRTVGQLRWKRAAEVAVGDILVCAEGYYRRTQGIGVGRARLIGAFLGDGWVRHANPEVSGYTVGLAIGNANETHTGRYGALVTEQLPTARWNSNVPGAFGLTCSSVAVWKELERLGVAVTSHEKRVPAYAFSLPPDEKIALLSGYFDADGSVANAGTSNHGRGAIVSVSRELTEGLRELAIGCGLRVTPVIKENRKTNFGSSVVFKCVLSADSVASLELWHASKYSNARATRYTRPQGLAAKKIGYLHLPVGTFAQRVRAVARSGEVEDVYDLTVSHPTHSFVCEGVLVHNCWKETHTIGTGDDEHEVELCVVRKGATPAFPGQKGFVGGSMGDDAVILEGNAAPADEETERAQRESLFSTVHGAGRVMSRTQAAGKRNRRGKVLTPGRISQEMVQEWLGKRGVILRGGGLDEAPQAYRRLPKVLQAQGDTIRVRHTLRPLIVLMAGAGEVDPYKD